MNYCGRTGEVYCKCLNKKDGISAMQVDIKATMRKLFTDHGVYTAFVIRSIVFNTPDTNVLIPRLLANQQDIGDQVKPIVGEQAGNQLTALLQEHIRLAGETVKAAKANDPNLASIRDQLYANGNDVGSFLASLNPVKLASAQAMFKTHLDHVVAMALALLQSEYNNWIKIYDSYYNQILEMSDAIVDALA